MSSINKTYVDDTSCTATAVNYATYADSSYVTNSISSLASHVFVSDPTVLWMEYLSESEILEILSKIKERASTVEFEEIVRKIIANNHFSEDFLMEFISFLPRHVVEEKHRRELKSGQYSRVSLFYTLK